MRKKKAMGTALITGAVLGISGPVLAEEKNREKAPKKTGIRRRKTRKTSGRRRRSGN